LSWRRRRGSWRRRRPADEAAHLTLYPPRRRRRRRRQRRRRLRRPGAWPAAARRPTSCRPRLRIAARRAAAPRAGATGRLETSPRRRVIVPPLFSAPLPWLAFLDLGGAAAGSAPLLARKLTRPPRAARPRLARRVRAALAAHFAGENHHSGGEPKAHHRHSGTAFLLAFSSCPFITEIRGPRTPRPHFPRRCRCRLGGGAPWGTPRARRAPHTRKPGRGGKGSRARWHPSQGAERG
jgi:hypothetical protein